MSRPVVYIKNRFSNDKLKDEKKNVQHLSHCVDILFFPPPHLLQALQEHHFQLPNNLRG